MKRITISIDDALAEALDGLLAARGYQGRSEGVRDLVRAAVDAHAATTTETTHAVASVSYVYDPRVRALAHRLASLRNARHDLVVSVVQTPLDHDDTLECLILKGRIAEVRAFADAVVAERGVRFGGVNLIGVAAHDDHDDPDDHEAHSHDGAGLHLSPRPG